MRVKGMITFSGMDCSGKSTQLNLLKEYLTEKNIAFCHVWSRGGYTPGIEFVKRILRGNKKMTPEEKMVHSQKVHKKHWKHTLLLYAAIVDLGIYYGIWFRIRYGNKLLLCDRYLWDSYIDFKMRYPDMEFESSFLWKLVEKMARKPDIAFMFYVSPEEALRRGLEKHEVNAEPLELREERRVLYMCEKEKGRWSHVIETKKSITGVHQDVFDALGIRE